MTKEEKFIDAAMQVLRLDMMRGHLRWSVVELAKATGCSRVWLYANFGKGKREMLENAVTIYLEDFYGFSAERQRFSAEHGYMGSLWRSRGGLEKMPEILIFYFHHRNRKTRIGELIRNAEARYLDALKSKMGFKTAEDIVYARTFLHGLATAFFLDRDETETAFHRFLALSQPLQKT